MDPDDKRVDGGNPAAPDGAGAAPDNAGAQPGGDGAAPQKPDRPDYIPEKFWDGAAGAPRLEELGKSHADLERRWHERNGAVPDDYKLPDSFKGFEDQIAPAQLKALKEAAKAEGYSQAGFDGLMRSIFGDPGEARRELEQVYGDKLDETLEAVRLFAGTLGEHEEAVRVMCSFPGGIKLLDDWRKASAEGVLPGQPGEAAGGKKTHEDLRKQMQDPRYWREKDPAFIAEVEQGFKELYPGQTATAALNPTGRAA